MVARSTDGTGGETEKRKPGPTTVDPIEAALAVLRGERDEIQDVIDRLERRRQIWRGGKDA